LSRSRAILAADPHLAGELGIERIGYIVLLQIAGAPAGDVKKAVSPSRYQVQIDDDRSLRLMTQLTNPCGLVGSCAGRSSKTSWCSSPKSISCKCLRLVKSQKCKRRPYLLPSRISGTNPFSNVSGVPHSLVTMVSKPCVVAKLLRAAIDFPAAERFECLVIHDKDAARRFAVLVAERSHIDAARAAMHCDAAACKLSSRRCPAAR
jgi:hypothetical protein